MDIGVLLQTKIADLLSAASDDSMAFDERGVMHIQGEDELVITLHVPHGHSTLYTYATLRYIDTANANLLRRVLKKNFFDVAASSFWLALEPLDSSLVLCNILAIESDAMTEETLGEHLQRLSSTAHQVLEEFDRTNLEEGQPDLSLSPLEGQLIRI